MIIRKASQGDNTFLVSHQGEVNRMKMIVQRTMEKIRKHWESVPAWKYDIIEIEEGDYYEVSVTMGIHQVIIVCQRHHFPYDADEMRKAQIKFDTWLQIVTDALSTGLDQYYKTTVDIARKGQFMEKWKNEIPNPLTPDEFRKMQNPVKPTPSKNEDL